MAIRMVSNALTSTGGGTLFTGDDDPELIADALPFAMKMYEALLEQDPDDESLLLVTGTAFISYANAFVYSPATMLGDSEFRRQALEYQRAKKLYLRGREYVLKALELRHPGFRQTLDEDRFEEALSVMTDEDVEYLYWAGAGWFGAISTDIFDMSLTITIPKAVALLVKALELDEEYGQGSLHDIFISLYGSLPVEMMFRPTLTPEDDAVKRFLAEYYRQNGVSTPVEKARFHYERAVELSENKKAGPHVALAESVSVKTQDIEEYKALLNKALEIDVDASPENRLLNTIAQRKAAWLLDTIEDRFLM
ncbi:MAG: TRAP transporter TatT component family protein [Spirochaetales bacterium]|nr:TRAP transporter TatT component family protein [Spirochaetales bacterium]